MKEPTITLLCAKDLAPLARGCKRLFHNCTSSTGLSQISCGAGGGGEESRLGATAATRGAGGSGDPPPTRQTGALARPPLHRRPPQEPLEALAAI
jgi:hypothetical protein